MVSVAVTARAQLQIDVIIDYLNARNPATGRNFLEQIKTAYRQLSEFPLSGIRGRTPNTRRLVVASFVLTYRNVPAGVEIVDIRHGRQLEAPLPEDV
ncbi:MAG TPA: type II toxin-antitoxin system RelE/ParE family toxin [Stellaceae bacterium]|nr:type II toxin-antitoxin system RelE/ParE family toxin [Stellaceae bacterium]